MSSRAWLTAPAGLGAWLLATPETVYRIMGFNGPPPDFDPGLIGDLQQACDPNIGCPAGFGALSPPGATHWRVPNAPPPGVPFEEVLIHGLQAAACCGGGGPPPGDGKYDISETPAKLVLSGRAPNPP